jgi:hypothetical protein
MEFITLKENKMQQQKLESKNIEYSNLLEETLEETRKRAVLESSSMSPPTTQIVPVSAKINKNASEGKINKFLEQLGVVPLSMKIWIASKRGHTCTYDKVVTDWVIRSLPNFLKNNGIPKRAAALVSKIDLPSNIEFTVWTPAPAPKIEEIKVNPDPMIVLVRDKMCIPICRWD